jgi:hypothetical protein
MSWDMMIFVMGSMRCEIQYQHQYQYQNLLNIFVVKVREGNKG